MTQPASITYWNRVEPSPRGDSLRAGLSAPIRDPLWMLTRQWQIGEFQGEDAASPAYVSVAIRSTRLDGWQTGDGASQPYDGATPLEVVTEREPVTPDLRTAVELGQALERRLTAAGLPVTVVGAFRQAYPVPPAASLDAAQQRDAALVRLLRVCAGRAVHGLDALAAAQAAAPGVPAAVALPPGTDPATVATVLSGYLAWVAATLGPIARTDPATWRPDRLEYALQVTGQAPDGARATLDAHPGRHGEFDWYAFDEATHVAPDGAANPVRRDTYSLLPAPVRFSGAPDPRWWNFEDARYNWSDVDTDSRDLARLLVIDFMLVQGTDWYLIPAGHPVGSLVAVEQLLIRDVFGGYTLAGRADATGTGPRRWSMYATTAPGGGLADYFVLPPSALRATVDGPDLEEVRFVRDEQANLVWAVETTTEDGTGRPASGRERATDTPDGAPAAPAGDAALRYRLQTTVPVNWIPFVPVQIDAEHRAVALQRAAMQRYVDGQLVAVQPHGRVLAPTGLPDPRVYLVREEEVPRTGVRVLRGAHRTRWVDGSTHLWTARRVRAGQGEAASGLRYDIADRDTN
jgi:hypothetical protein